MRPPRFAEAPLYMGTLKAGQLRYLRYPHSRCTRCWLRLRVCSPRARCVRTCGPGAGCYCSPVDFPQIILCAGYDFGHPALDEIPLKKRGVDLACGQAATAATSHLLYHQQDTARETRGGFDVSATINARLPRCERGVETIRCSALHNAASGAVGA